MCPFLNKLLFLTDTEIAFKDESGGVSLLNVETLRTKRYVQDFTYVSK